MAKKKQLTQEDLYRAIGKLARSSPDAQSQTVIPAFGEQAPKTEGHHGIGGGLKNIGKGILKSLTVPQATLFTLFQKGAHGISGGAVKDTSWKNLGGAWRGSAYHGGAGLLEGFGVDSQAAKKWGGLGLDLVADPLNILGGTAIYKGLKLGEEAAKVGEATTKGADIFKAAPRTATEIAAAPDKTSLGKALVEQSKTGGVAQKSMQEKLAEVEADIEKAVKGHSKRSHLRDERENIILYSGHAPQRSQEIEQEIQKLREQRKQFTNRRGSSQAAAIDIKISKLQDEHSALDQYGNLGSDIAKAKRHKKKTSDLIAEAEGLRGSLSKLWDTRALQAADQSAVLEQHAPKLEGLFRTTTPEARTAYGTAHAKEVSPINNEIGLLADPKLKFEQLGAALTNAATKGPRTAGIKFGIGKHSKKLDLRIPLKEKSLESSIGRNAIFTLNPAQKIVHGLRRSTSELAQDVNPKLEQFAQDIGISHTGRVHVQNIGTIMRKNKIAGEQMRNQLRAAGEWGAPEDQALQYILTSGKRFAAAEGKKTYAMKLAEAERKLAKQEAKKNPDASKILKAIQQVEKYNNKGDYITQGLTADSLKARARIFKGKVQEGELPTALTFKPGKQTSLNPDKELQLEDPYKALTRDEYIAEMEKNGMSKDIANQYADNVEKHLGGFSESQQLLGPGIPLRPEWDSFLTHGERTKAHYTKMADAEIQKLIDVIGPDAAHIFEGINIRRAPGAIGSLPAGQKLQYGIALMKAVFTTINPSHYVNNAVGDYINRMVTGRVNHLGTTAAIPRSKYQKLASGDKQALDATYNVNGKVYSGSELMTLSRLSGLGRGYVGADINDVVDLMHMGRNPIAIMGRFNMRRENAQRVETWVKNMERGDNPFTAGIRSLEVHFDYNQLTDFERVWLRNALLFYTWLKRNSMLHANGVIKRPGLYQGYADLERNRQQFANEPGYYGEQGAITIPGLGNIKFANPINDMYKWDLSQSAIRKNLLGSVTPPVRLPAEILFNRNTFTGGPVESYTDQQKPYFLGRLFGNGTTVDGKPTIDAQVANILSGILGPQAGTAQSTYLGDTSGPSQVLQRVFGIGAQHNLPEKFLQNREQEAIRKKADATRKANKETAP